MTADEHILTAEKLIQIAPNCPDSKIWCDAINNAMTEFEINNLARIAAFLAQILHESGEFKHLIENLNYTSATRIYNVWPKRMKNTETAGKYVLNRMALANFVYAHKNGNGKAESGDGWRYRGRGLIQLTGRANYALAASALGLPLISNPELLEQPKNAARSAAWFWHSKGLNKLADDLKDDDDDADFARITKRINNRLLGLKERRKYWAKAKMILAQKNSATAANPTNNLNACIKSDVTPAIPKK